MNFISKDNLFQANVNKIETISFQTLTLKTQNCHRKLALK